jgi:1,4-alpha-glucan branching enzyme
MSKAQEAVTPENDAHFTLHAPDAESVYIARTFNDWKPHATPMGSLNRDITNISS